MQKPQINALKGMLDPPNKKPQAETGNLEIQTFRTTTVTTTRLWRCRVAKVQWMARRTASVIAPFRGFFFLLAETC